MNSLYQLIQSLSRTEKKFFKLYAAKYDVSHQKHELLLFEAILKTTNPTDEKVMKRIESKQVLKQFKLYKHLLYKNLLTHLADNHPEKSVENEIIGTLKRANVLCQKAMYEESVSFLDKAIALAQENELFALNLHLCEVRNWIQSNITDEALYHRDNIEGITGQFTACEQQKNLIAHSELNNKIHHRIMLWGASEDNDIVKEFPKDILLGLKRLKNATLSKRAQLLYWKSLVSEAYVHRNYKLARDYLLKIVGEFEKVPAGSHDRTERLFRIYYMLLWCYFFLGEYEKADNIFNKADSLPAKSPHLSLLKFDLFINYKILSKLHFGKGGDTDALEEKLLEAYSSYLGSLNIQNRSVIDLNMATLFFAEGNFHKSYEWVQRALKQQGRRLNFEVYVNAKILNILVQYELKLTKLLKYSVLSVKRFIRNRRSLTKEENLLLSAVLRLSAKAGEKESQLLHKCLTDWARGKPVLHSLEKLA